MSTSSIKKRIKDIFHLTLGPSASFSRTNHMIPETHTATGVNHFKGKLYETFVLSQLLKKLTNDEGFTFELRNGTSHLRLRPNPGMINRSYSWIDAFKGGNKIGEIWTSVEFASLSHLSSGRTNYNPGDYHELDIGFYMGVPNGHPSCDSVIIGIECKNTGMKKSILREVLGLRRELSVLTGPVPTMFISRGWTSVPAVFPSLLMLYCTDSAVSNYADPGAIFGIDFHYQTMK